MQQLTDLFSRLSIAEAKLEQTSAQIAAVMVLPMPPARRAEVSLRLGAARLQIATLRDLQHKILGDPTFRLLPFSDPRNARQRELMARLLLWERLHAELRTLLRNRQIPLWVDQAADNALLGEHDLLWRRLHGWLNGRGAGVPIPPAGHFNDIPLNSTQFLKLMALARRVVAALGKDHLDFLDVGCGNGMKLWQAADFVTRANGLEYTPALVALAQDLISNFMPVPAQVMQQDALEFDGYGRYDVIYFYKPMSDPDMLATMERRIVAQARPGTVLIAPYHDFCQRVESLGIGQIASDVYITGHSAKALKALQRRTGRMGFADPFHASKEEKIGGFLAPMITALRRQGHPVSAKPLI